MGTMYLKSFVKRVPENSSHILIAMLAVVGCMVAVLSWQISDSAGENLSLRLQENRLRTRLAPQPIEIHARAVSKLPDLPKFDAFQSVVVDTQRLFEEARLVLRDATHTPQLTDTDSDTGRVQITVHAKGEYHAIKKAIAALLAQHVELALKSLTFSREQSTDGEPQVEACFTFFYSKQK